jgi:glycosyltransferase involved in cell wall biosynthesis
MADRVVELLGDPIRRKLLGAAGRVYMLNKFSWKKYGENLTGFYEGV